MIGFANQAITTAITVEAERDQADVLVAALLVLLAIQVAAHEVDADAEDHEQGGELVEAVRVETRGDRDALLRMSNQPLIGPESVVSSPIAPMIANHSRICTSTGMLRSVST